LCSFSLSVFMCKLHQQVRVRRTPKKISFGEGLQQSSL
jgi:hypothetical protein